MTRYNFLVYDPPAAIASGEACSPDNVDRSWEFLFARHFHSQDDLAELCRLYGYLMLLGQELENELRTCLRYMTLSLSARGLRPRFTGDIAAADFLTLVDMFAAQLHTEDRDTRRFVSDLHKARKIRNRLAHHFLSPDEIEYYITQGGRNAVVNRLTNAARFFSTLAVAINVVSRAYAAEVGMTTDAIARLAAAPSDTRKRLLDEISDILSSLLQDNGT
jgi:hypothetical protein